MAYSIIEKFNKLVRKISTVALCGALAFTGLTFLEGTDTAHAASETGIAWTRVYNDKQMLQFKDAMDKGNARILMIYNDKYYIGDSTGISGHKYNGRIIPSAFKRDQDYFVTRKSYNTPTVTYAGRDGDNEVSKYTLRLRENDDSSGKLFLMHREWDFFGVPYTDYCLTFQYNKDDNKDDDEAWNCTSSRRFDSAGFMFDPYSTAFDRQYFLDKRLAEEHNGQPLSKLKDNTLKELKTQVDNDVYTAYVIGCLRNSTGDVDQICKTLKSMQGKELQTPFFLFDQDVSLSEDMFYMENPKPTNKNDKAYQSKLAAYQIEAAELDKEWLKYRNMAEEQIRLWYDKEWELATNGRASMFYNISGEFDLMVANSEGSSVLDAGSYSPYGAAEFEIYIGVPVDLPTLSQSLEVDKNTTYTFKDVTVGTNEVFTVSEGATVILQGTVLNYGYIRVKGTLILDEGCILTDDTRLSYKDYKKVAFKTGEGASEEGSRPISEEEAIHGYGGNSDIGGAIMESDLRRGSIEIDGGFVYVRKGAALVQHARPKLTMNSLSHMLIDGTVLIDGVMELNGAGKSCDIEIGPTGRLGYGCYINWDKYGDEPQQLLADLEEDTPLSSIVKPQLSDNLECTMDRSATIHNYGTVELFSGANDKARTYNIDSNARIYGYEGYSTPFSSRMSGINKTIIK